MNTRTTVTLSTNLIDDLMEEIPVKTKAKAVVLAIQDYLRRKKLLKLTKLHGKIRFDLDATEIRKINNRGRNSYR